MVGCCSYWRPVCQRVLFPRRTGAAVCVNEISGEWFWATSSGHATDYLRSETPDRKSIRERNCSGKIHFSSELDLDHTLACMLRPQVKSQGMLCSQPVAALLWFRIPNCRMRLARSSGLGYLSVVRISGADRLVKVRSANIMHRFVHLLSGNLCRFPIIRGGQLFSEASMPKRVGYFNRGNYVSIISALAIEELFVLGMGTAWNSN